VFTSEFFFGDKVREGLTLVGAFPEGTTVIGSKRDSVAKKKFTGVHICVSLFPEFLVLT
jgi:hypothetical protein